MSAARCSSAVGFAAALGCAAAALLGCGGAEPRLPSVVLVTIDTLRADRVWPVAGTREQAPFLASLADGGVSFLRAYSTSSWTAPAIASLLTGTYPSRHGVENGAFWDGGILGQEVLPDDLQLLPELLREHGYRTFGVTANGHLAPGFGFGRGFDRYACVGFSDAEALSRVLAEWLPEIRSGGPYLLWLHLLDPHAPYTRREPWFSERAGPASRPELEDLPRASEYAKLGVAPGSDALDYVEALYDSEVSRIDELLRETLATLAPGDGDLLVVTSDHGEEFLEHGRFGHGHALFEETVRIPLILRYPAGRHAGVRVEEPVSLVDLLPTILDEVGIEAPQGLQGRVLRPDAPGAARPLHLELSRIDRVEGVVDDGWKLVDRSRPEASRALYDLRGDPGEHRDRSASQAARARALLELARRHREQSRAGRSGEPRRHSLDAEQLEALRSLGYLP